MVDHDSRKRVAKNFRHFFFQEFFQKFFKNSSKIPPDERARGARRCGDTKFSTKFSIFLKKNTAVPS
jgi:hypothetical protein